MRCKPRFTYISCHIFSHDCVFRRYWKIISYMQQVLIDFYYIPTDLLTEKFIRKWFLANQRREQRYLSDVKKVTRSISPMNDVFLCDKNDTSDQKPQSCVSFGPKFPPLCIVACNLQSPRFPSCLADIQREKTTRQSFSPSFSRKKVKLVNGAGQFRNVSLSTKKIVECRQNNSRWGTEREI